MEEKLIVNEDVKKEKVKKSVVAVGLCWFFFHFLAFYTPQIIMRGADRIVVGSRIDDMIPFVPMFVLFYALAYVQWIVNIFVLAREHNDKFLFKYFAVDTIGKVICAIFYIVVPTTMLQPEIHPEADFWQLHLNIIYSLDEPINLFPSLHVFESLLDLVVVMQAKRTSTAFKVGSIILTALVFASTVLIKQHVLIDLPAGALLFVLMVFIVDRTNVADKFQNLFQKLDKPIKKTDDIE